MTQTGGKIQVSATSLSILAAGVVIVGLYWFADLLKPLALGLFLWLTIDAFAAWLVLKLPFLSRRAAVPIALLLVVAFFGVAGAFIVDYASSFAGSFADYRQRLDGVVADIWHHFPSLGAPPTLKELLANVNPSEFLKSLAAGFRGFASQALFVLIYVACLFAAQASLLRKIVILFPDRQQRLDAMNLSRAITQSMEQYLYVQTVTGLMIAGACWLLFAVVGLQNGLFWAFIIFILAYIPVLGGAAASLLPALFALVQFPTYWPALVILIMSQAIQFVVGNIIQPRMTGDTLNLSVLMVFLSLAFWGKLWGGAGAFLAVPLTVMVMIILAQFPSTRPIAVLMSHNGKPVAGLKHE